jgi:hypothetical protein
MEATLKLSAFGMSYFKNNWNRFDFMVVVSSMIDIMMELMDTASLQMLRVGP